MAIVPQARVTVAAVVPMEAAIAPMATGEPIELAVVTCPGIRAAAAVMRWAVEIGAATADHARAPAAVAAHPACAREAAVVGEGGRFMNRRKNMKSYLSVVFVILSCFLVTQMLSAQQTQSQPVLTGKAFGTPQQALDAVIAAAEKFDTAAIEEIFGPEGKEILVTAEPPNDKEIAKTFAELAREKNSISIDPKNKNHAVILVGKDNWPFAVPLVKSNGKWYFDTDAGIDELTYRRVGGNELDAIEICRGFVEAQEEYALQKHDGSEVNQYAQRIISTAGKQDGLAWQTAEGKWEGPIGENVANAIEKGYTAGQPYHGYYFKVLKGQGPAAPLGEMDYIVHGAMIGGFALVAAPAEYAVTGVKTFLVSNDGVVYEKDFGDNTGDEFKKMDRFNPDETWTPVQQ
jgi:DUF2950 family protein